MSKGHYRPMIESFARLINCLTLTQPDVRDWTNRSTAVTWVVDRKWTKLRLLQVAEEKTTSNEYEMKPQSVEKLEKKETESDPSLSAVSCVRYGFRLCTRNKGPIIRGTEKQPLMTSCAPDAAL